MDFKKLVRKLGFSEQFIHAFSSRRRVLISGFGLGLGASLLLLTLISLNSPLKASLLNPMFQGFNSFNANSSSSSSSSSPWSLSFSNSSVSSSISSDLQRSKNLINEGRVKDKTHEPDASETSKNPGLLGSDRVETVSEKTQVENFSEEEQKASYYSREGIGGKPHLKNSSSLDKEAMADKNQKGKSLDDGKGFAVNGGNVTSVHREGRISEATQKENSSQTGKIPSSYHDSGQIVGSSGKCDIFDGKWVRDDTMPYYPAGSCPHIDRDFNCHLHGRPDDEFLRWRWQPNGCDIPRLNAIDFLERLRGKRLVFVGDSLNRNMWESLVCILRHHVTKKSRVYEISGRREFKKKGFYAFRYEDYNCSVDFVSSPFVVRESSSRGRNGFFETLRLDLMDRTTEMYREADVVVFNTGHWWTHEKTSRGEDYYQEGNYVHPKLKVLEAYKKALSTWARWIDKNIDANRTQVFFRGYSVTHFRGRQWNSGGQCHKETEPIFNQTYVAKYPSKMRALEPVLQQMRTPVVYLNISRLTDHRKDAHPSIYRKEYKNAEELVAAERSQDCSHWCLPGVPDTWNQLLYASLLKTGSGSWSN